MLRLGICRADDWTGSAVDFVERGFLRFCKANGSDVARRVWDGYLVITDQMFEMTDRERRESQAERDQPPQSLFLVGRFDYAASVPVGATLAVLDREHPLLPAAFYAGFRHCLWKWLFVYDHQTASEDAEMGMLHLEEGELETSIYPKVAATIPTCLRGRLKMSPSRALALLEEIQPKLSGRLARQVVSLLLDVFRSSDGYAHAWPRSLIKQVPEIEDYLADCDGIGPGCLLNWYEGDAISACFDEHAAYLGQNGPLEPTNLRLIQLSRSGCASDKQVQQMFDYIAAMLRSLASAAKLVELIRGIDDEHLRKHRIESTVPLEPSPFGVRDQ
jgi:hypothetical protein